MDTYDVENGPKVTNLLKKVSNEMDLSHQRNMDGNTPLEDIKTLTTSSPYHPKYSYQ